jgi:hypothetical protein
MSVSCIALYRAITESVMLSYYNILELFKWTGYIIRMEEYHIKKKILGGSFRGKKPVGRHHSGWKDNMQKDAVSLLHIQNWKLVTQSRENWRKKIREAMSRIWSRAP